MGIHRILEMYLLEITVYNKQNVFHINLKYINNITTKNAQHIRSHNIILGVKLPCQ